MVAVQKWRPKADLLLFAVLLCLLGAVACQEDDAVPTVPAQSPTATAEIERPAGTVAALATSENQIASAPDLDAEPTANVADVADAIPEVAEPAEPKVLTVCMAAEPVDLYLYGVDMLVQQGVLHGIYENLITNLGYAYQAQGLEKLPSIADGDAVVERVVVLAGDRVVNAAGDVVPLTAGEEVFDYTGERVTFTDGTVLMSQMEVDFKFKEMKWEDGMLVTAADSVFSFEIAADPETRVTPYKSDRTERYEALDDTTVRWTGVPGFIDREYFLNVWQPLPQHLLGELTAAELLTDEEVLRRPLANGPFKLEEWIPGEQLTLVRNEAYYRASEGLPNFDQVVFRFLYEPDVVLNELLQGDCDIASQEGLSVAQIAEIEEASTVGQAALFVQSSPVMEHLDFGVNPSAEYAASRPDWFADVRVRQAIGHCIDRDALLDTVFVGYGETLDAYVTRDHPLFPADGMRWPYDPETGMALLESAGYSDSNGDGVRENSGAGTPFSISLLTSQGSELRLLMAEMIASDLAACGISAAVETIPGETLFLPGPDGALFGRQFDLALFAWSLHTDPICETYLGDQIPGALPEFPAGWTGSNVTGWQNDAYDAACSEALVALLGSPEYITSHQTALRIFMEELPSIPLYMRVRLAATSPDVANFHLDPSEPSEFWNLYELDFVEQ